MRHQRTSLRFAKLTLRQEAPQWKGAPVSSLSQSCPPVSNQRMAHLWQRRIHNLAVSHDHLPDYLPRSPPAAHAARCPDKGCVAQID